MILTARDIQANYRDSCQVCIVGSGAGGAAVAAELAEAGYDVLILEEGGYHPTTSFSHDPLRMLPRLYRNAGGDSTLGNSPIMFTEGRCVGGGTVINAGICYRTPDPILHLWSMAMGTLQLLPEAMDDYFRRVEKSLNVTEVPDSIIGEDGRRMRKAAEALGYRYTRVKRNIFACQGTNLCILGCPTGAKQSTLVSYIPRARKAGARVLANCRVEHLLLDGDRVTGVQAHICDPASGKKRHQVEIRADAVFLAAGSLQTPALLHRSKIARKIKGVGKTLFLHPNTKCVGEFDEEINAWNGSIQGFQIDQFAEEGYTFGSTFLPPGILALSSHTFGRQLQQLMENYNRLCVWGVLVEDIHPGRVRFTRSGQPLPFYRVTAQDRDRFRDGIARLAEIQFAAGARRVHLPIQGAAPLQSRDEIEKFRRMKIKPSQISVFSVHLMGTCRMGLDPRISVVDANHKVHGLRNLFIADASVIPSPIRVNPMITIMTMATRAAEMFREAMRQFSRAA